MSIGEIQALFQLFADSETFWIGMGVLVVWGLYITFKFGHAKGLSKYKDEVEKNAELTTEIQSIRERLHRAETDRDEFREKFFNAQQDFLKIKLDAKMKDETIHVLAKEHNNS